jgi:hypothetical protein
MPRPVAHLHTVKINLAPAWSSTGHPPGTSAPAFTKRLLTGGAIDNLLI